MDKNTEPGEILKQYFGYERFRAGQEDVVCHLLRGRDALCVMPTGAGKSICYQVPALMLDGMTLVISPLISLMKDQVAALTQAGVSAAFCNSSLTDMEYRELMSEFSAGRIKILYVAPERLLIEGFLSAVRRVKISLIAVDEAHCVSQWGQDFRPSYLKITEFIRTLSYRPVVGAFTATATREVKQDIERILELRDPYTITTGFDRPNLYFGVRAPKDKKSELLALLAEHKGSSGIVYCATRKTVEEICELLQENGVPAVRYHAGLPDEERKRNQEDFVYDRKPVMVATNAFGMGIDKSNVSFVIHYNMPKNIESYYQEAGRAGRDGSEADCILLFAPKDVSTNRFLIERTEENEEIDEQTREAIRRKDYERLKAMTFYCKTTDCLRHYILRYFGESAPCSCGNCSNCSENTETVDITIDAQKILSCVARTRQRFGVTMIVDILRGSKNERLLRMGLQSQTTYGIMAEKSAKEVREIIDCLVIKNALAITDSDYPVLMLGEEAKSILYDGAAISMKKLPAAAKKTERSKKPAAGTVSSVDRELFESLRELRMRLASQQHVPAFVIFSDATLRDMCVKKPADEEEFLSVSGVGRKKLELYGAEFLAAIAAFSRAGGESEKSFPIKPWSDEEDAQLTREAAVGVTEEQMAKIHLRSREEIHDRIRTLALQLDF